MRERRSRTLSARQPAGQPAHDVFGEGTPADSPGTIHEWEKLCRDADGMGCRDTVIHAESVNE